MRNRSLRYASWMIIVLAIAVPTALITDWARDAVVIERVTDDTRIVYSSSSRLVIPGSCATLRWRTEGAQEITLNDLPVAAEGEREVCPDTSTGYRLSYLTESDVRIQHSHFVRVFFTTNNTRLLGAAFLVYLLLAVFLVALLGDLPVISAPWLPLRRRIYAAATLPAQKLSMLLHQTAVQRDLILITILALLAALPLVVLRFTSSISPSRVAFPVIVAWLAILMYWVWPDIAVWRAPHVTAPPPPRRESGFSRWTLVSALLLLCAIVGFYLPMLNQFWMGGDEIRVLQDAARGWSSIAIFDEAQARPFTPLVAIIAAHLTPESVEGFLWMAFALRFLSAALIYGIVQLMLPRREGMALAAALLFIVNPSEHTRFLAVYMQGYNGLVFLLLLSLYLYLRSGRDGNRLMLVLSCGALGAALLVGEPGFPLTLIWPVLAWIAIVERWRVVWHYAWVVTVALFASRFLIYQALSETTYQQGVLRDTFALGSVITQFLRHLVAPVRYVVVRGASLQDWLIALALGVIVAAALLALARRRRVARPLTDKHYTVGVLLALAATVLGFLPFVTITGILGSVRTQFMSAPAQAVLLALAIGWMGRFFAQRFRLAWVAGATSLLIMLPTAAAPNSQAYRPINPEARYAHTGCIAQQLLERAPAVSADTILLFVQDETTESPLGWNYYYRYLSIYLYGVEGFPIADEDTLGVRYTLDPTEQARGDFYLPYALDQLVAFEIAPDRTVTLLEELPASIVPDHLRAGEEYDPHARILSGDSELPRFLKCPP